MAVGDVGQLRSRVLAWVADDPDPATRPEAEVLLARADAGDAAAADQLIDAFDGHLPFGTAGLRAEMGAGPRRMNRVVVAQTSAGLADFLLARATEPGDAAPSVVIGHDARVNSDVFARDAARVLAGAGLEVIMLPSPVPTPVTAFAVRHLEASAGVQITASHNPPGDNGYKVYLGGEDAGAQIIPPVDRAIAERIAEAARTPFPVFPRSDSATIAGPEVLDAYVAAAVRAASPTASPHPSWSAPVTVVYSAMHGVGAALTHRVLASAGLPALHPVHEQEAPDGTFPTVVFPNPEEPEALDLAFRAALERQADLVLAHDPDADRLAVAAPDPAAAAGYRRLTGNELGLLLGWRVAERELAAADREGRPPRGVLANTIVSSPALRAVADAYGLDHVETLSGSKWLARVPDLLFGYEEALGYLTAPEVAHDKDGITAAAEVLALACELHAEQRTLWDLLDEAGERFGHFASAQIVVRSSRMAEAEALAARIRSDPPDRFGSLAVHRRRDFLDPGVAPVPANVLAYDLEDGSRVMIRPSGTEPKLKVYLDAFSDRGTAAERRANAAADLEAIAAAVHDTLRRAGA